MPLNKKYDSGNGLSVVCTAPAAPDSGDPVLYGSMTGIALKDEKTDGTTAVDFSTSVWELSVTTDGAITAGDALFLNAAGTVISNTSTGFFFGFAMADIAAGSDDIDVLHVQSPGANSLGAGTVGEANLAANAVAAAKIKADAVITAKILDANVTLAKLAAESVDGSKVAEAASGSVIGAVPLLYHTTIADVGAPTDYDIAVTSKIHVVDAWLVNLAAGHATDDHIQLKSTAAVITNEISKTAADHAIIHATTIDHANADIANGGILRWTATKATNIACEAYVLAYRIA